LQVKGNTVPLQGVGFGGNLAQSLRGSIPVQSLSTVSSFNLGLTGADQQAVIDDVLPVYDELPSPQTSYRELVHKFGKTLFGNLDAVASIDTTSYMPANGASYPSSSYGRRMKEAAQMIKDPNIGLEVVTIDVGGYDTHSNQGAGEPEGRLSRSLGEFSQGIAALVADLGDKMDDVVIVTMSEFGRTAKPNGSAGTDHGNASAWFVLGNKVQGGIYMRDGQAGGGWPGLSDEALFKGRFLASTVDCRDIFGDILFQHLGHSVSSIGALLPGYTDYTSLNLMQTG
ncbi:MAG: DUF1501 domain-containing protein, partial [Methyloprofundus sp.]|nr:DUF1501 domain-containing protein [Methyloprofundus sp.]